MNKDFLCFSPSLFRELRKNGFQEKGVMPDKKDTGRVIWIYARTPELDEFLTSWFGTRQK